MAANSSYRISFGKWGNTLVGKVVLSAARAFIGVFIAAEAQLFDAIVKIASSHTHLDFSVGKSLLLATAAAAVTAAIRAVQHYFFDPNPTP